MFTIRSERVFDWPVTVTFPGDDGGTVEQVFTARFRVGRIDDMRALLGGAGADAQSGRKLLEDTLVGWSGVVDEAGEPVPFGDEFKGQLLGDVFVLTALSRALARCLAGAVEKNSARPGATGRAG